VGKHVVHFLGPVTCLTLRNGDIEKGSDRKELSILSFNVLFKSSKEPDKEDTFAALRIPRLLEMLGLFRLFHVFSHC
jgi:hypothetical protein